MRQCYFYDHQTSLYPVTQKVFFKCDALFMKLLDLGGSECQLSHISPHAFSIQNLMFNRQKRVTHGHVSELFYLLIYTNSIYLSPAELQVLNSEE